MKNFNFFAIVLLSGTIIMAGCSGSKFASTNAARGGIIGGASGALIGAGVGTLVGDGKGAVIGAAVGAAVGTGAGVLIGNRMDKQKAELEQIEGAQVETIVDVNNLQAIKVTFDSGILFDTGRSNLNTVSRESLAKFANSLKANPETDVTIYGHTDNTGSRDVNVRLSNERAESVAKFLIDNSINGSRLTTEGKASDEPVADNSTAEGRALNRRVEIFITANENMIQQAEAGALN